MDSTLNILIRTKGVPHNLSNLLSSIRTQDYRGIVRIIVCVDDELAYKYACANLDKSNVVYIKTDFEIKDNSLLYSSVYNTYYNNMLDIVEDGYVWLINGNDYLSDHTSISRMMNHACKDSVCLFFVKDNGVMIPNMSKMDKIKSSFKNFNALIPYKFAKSVKLKESYINDGSYIEDVIKAAGSHFIANEVIYEIKSNWFLNGEICG